MGELEAEGAPASGSDSSLPPIADFGGQDVEHQAATSWVGIGAYVDQRRLFKYSNPLRKNLLILNVRNQEIYVMESNLPFPPKQTHVPCDKNRL